ncbi:SMI1/KNR4 family protein [Streptomyces sp. CBMA152]|uniref:SMI1/KNR4 family protein n=1 Tax=Streptomyces sp. CBMA152 TaxID=1896312 RepID=UPI001660C0AE|nr:SMI1/KNR4 family protein [Streptomyces sp. CBMA152]
MTDAWQRIETWLRAHAPASCASLESGASQEEISSAEGALGVRIPADLKALWVLRDGVRIVRGEAFLMDNARLIGIAQVVELHGYWGKNYDFRDDPDEPSDLWDHHWIPVCTLEEHNWANGLFLDAGTGELWSWDEHANRQVEYESLTSYLEGMADALEAPGLFGGARPGLEYGALVWRVPDYSDPEHP